MQNPFLLISSNNKSNKKKMIIHSDKKMCFICKKKIGWLADYFEDYHYEITQEIEKDGILYEYVDRYYHKDCALKNKPK